MKSFTQAYIFVFLFLAGTRSIQAETSLSSDVLNLKSVYSDALHTTIGLAFPESSEDAFRDDFLVNITTSIPYGYAGFTASPANFSARSFAVTSFIWSHEDFTVPVMVLSSSESIDSGLVTSDLGTVTPSNLTWITSDTASFLFRCQNCSIGVSPGEYSENQFPLAMIKSADTPGYPTGDDGEIYLSLHNLTTVDVIFNVTAARTSEYDSLLEAAGVFKS
ncbi:hypothetical protein K435DRAFT_782734 [Dendrothele bispora CBS 962.96]|uniref:Cellobiose dehydrogenase-like cytochrome domain-containing protein n=1 Tax=Dendrothele bispora (strain CBS 962.96) TaxID=1314807 RepID=A0A4S8LED5_DENBC|nr:hypothetical protein K435DRAFT_782734 [Dendrothele bispora CBS 962.96]